MHPGWEYSGVQDPTRETSDNIKANKMVELLQEMFQNINNWLTPEQVRTYLQVVRDPLRQCRLNPLIFSWLFMLCSSCDRPWIASCLTSPALKVSRLSRQFLSESGPRVPTQPVPHLGVPVSVLRRHELANAKPKWPPLLPPLKQGRPWARKP
jgi:hypothetical protein